MTVTVLTQIVGLNARFTRLKQEKERTKSQNKEMHDLYVALVVLGLEVS